MRELEDDPAYGEQILPMALSLLGRPEGPLIDLGCGEGRLLRAVGGVTAFGCDLSLRLLEAASDAAPAVQSKLPDLSWLRSASMASAVAILVIEHLSDIRLFFQEGSRILRPGGVLVVVMNHPAYTPDGAGPLVDLSDGEVLWRWGSYFEEGSGVEPAGPGSLVFHHRSLGNLLTTAAEAGFSLAELVEAGLNPASVARDPGLVGQEHFPRLLGAKWRLS